MGETARPTSGNLLTGRVGQTVSSASLGSMCAIFSQSRERPVRGLSPRRISRKLDAIHRQELPDVRMVGFLHFTERPEEDNLAVEQKHYSIGDLAHQV